MVRRGALRTAGGYRASGASTREEAEIYSLTLSRVHTMELDEAELVAHILAPPEKRDKHGEKKEKLLQMARKAQLRGGFNSSAFVAPLCVVRGGRSGWRGRRRLRIAGRGVVLFCFFGWAFALGSVRGGPAHALRPEYENELTGHGLRVVRHFIFC